MAMQKCARCHIRPAVVFVTRIENGEAKNEGLCIKCAKELGIPQVDQILKQMGISDDDLDRMDTEMNNLIVPDENSEPSVAGDEENNAPPVDFKRLFSSLGQIPKSEKQKSRQETKNVKERKYLTAYCTDLTGRAREGKLDRVIGRERELNRVIQILLRRQKNNPCLIGEPGVGKTALAEALAQRIVGGGVPYKLLDKEVFILDLTAMVAGTQFRGQFEGRMKGLIDEIKEQGNIILVIDEMHNLVGAGDAEGSMNAANIMKPALSRGDIQVIGATTLSEYRKYIEKDSALERRFQPIIIKEPSVADSIEILQGIKHYYEQYHGITIQDDVVRRAVVLSERYITDRFLPDKAIDLLDEASSYVAINSPVVGQCDRKKDELGKCKQKRAAAENSPIPDNAAQQEDYYKNLATLRADELTLQNEVTSLEIQRKNVCLTTSDLADVIEIWTGIPAGNITQDEFVRLGQLEEGLKKRIIGQDKAVDAVVRAIKRSRAGVVSKRKPVSFIFAGPTGVGKTELVKQLANQLFDSPETLIRIDMSEYMEKYSVSKLIGSPPGYVGYDEAGQLTEKIRRKPYSVILFDEIEKAHPDVLNILLQILDDGIITDSHGKEVNFENTVIVMTTNAGSNFTTSPAGFGESAVSAAETKTEKALSEFLRPEFINRIDEVITFNPLTEEDFAKIVRIMLSDLEKALSERGIELTYTDALCAYVVKNSYSRKFGARNMRRYIEMNIEDRAANLIIENCGVSIKTIHFDTAQVDGQETIIAGIN